MKLSIYLLQTFFILLNNHERTASGVCSSAYGAKPCPYIPAPPGERPPCARNGNTYCEYPEHYPTDLVMHLLEKWKYDHTTLLQNESANEYANYYFLSSDSYGPPPTNTLQRYPAPVYGPPPQYQPGSSSPHAYIPPPPIKINYTDDHQPTHLYRQYHHYKSRFPAMHHGDGGALIKHLLPPRFDGFEQNVWNKWNSGKAYMRRKRAVASSKRRKRQSGGRGGAQTLCEARTQFIMPRAAMNNKGDWMYVVNMPEVDGRYSQLVKSETCATQRCSRICSLPDGYTSRCEQRFVQKRLIAIEPGGGNLYTDVFWFPSCCICTITR